MIELKKTNYLIEYPDALNFMEQRVENIAKNQASELVWLVEHPPLYTAGTSAEKKDLLGTYKLPVYDAGRGGKYTYHGIGQRVVYFMISLRNRNINVHQFVNMLEDIIILTLNDFKIKAEKRSDRIGIWVKTKNSEEKIAALGIRIRKGISFHGIAINISPNMEHFNGIIPCGISNFGVTSMQKLGLNISLDEFDAKLIPNISNILQDELKSI
ncbi:MAG: lipoyl(octanoyl) transferase LipB [Alphaproteobacteria bacterium]